MSEIGAGSAEDPAEAGGHGPSEMLELPSLERGIVQLVLRQRSTTHAELMESMKSVPGAGELSNEEALALLDGLLNEGWLAREGEGPAMSYKVNLRRPPARRHASNIQSLLDF